MPPVKFTTTILRFGQHGEKTGWTYIVVPADVAQKLQPGNRKGFRTKGKLDTHKFSGKSIIPMGKGEFILTLDTAVRKAIGKKHGAMVDVQIEFDTSEYELNREFMECLKDEPEAFKIFSAMPPSHQRYYSKWIDSAKTEETKAKRIAACINGFIKKLTFAEVLRSQKERR